MTAPTFGRLEALLVAIPANTYGFKVDAGANAYVPAGDYYLSSTAPTGSASLIAAVQTLLAAAVAASTAAISPTTGAITFTFGSGTHTLTWASTNLRDLLGFTGTLTPAAAAFTATKLPTCAWMPNAYQSEHRGSANALGGRADDTVTARSQSGAPWKTTYNTYRDQRFAFVGLTKAKVWTEDEAAPLNGAWETFWANHLSAAGSGRFRHYTNNADATSYTASVSGLARDYVFDRWEDPTRLKPNVDALWAVRFNAKYLVTP